MTWSIQAPIEPPPVDPDPAAIYEMFAELDAEIDALYRDKENTNDPDELRLIVREIRRMTERRRSLEGGWF